MIIIPGELFRKMLVGCPPKGGHVQDQPEKASATLCAGALTYFKPHPLIDAALIMTGSRDASGLVRLLVVLAHSKIVFSALATGYPIEAPDEYLYWQTIVEQAGVEASRADSYADCTSTAFWFPTSARGLAEESRVSIDGDIKSAVNGFLADHAPVVLKVASKRPLLWLWDVCQLLLKSSGNSSAMINMLERESLAVSALANAEHALMAHLLHANAIAAARFLGLKYEDYMRTRAEGLRDLRLPISQLVRMLRLSKLVPYPPVSLAEWQILQEVTSALKPIEADKKLARRVLRLVFSRGFTPEARAISKYLVARSLSLTATVNFDYGWRHINPEGALYQLLNVVDAQANVANPSLEQVRKYLGGDSIAELAVLMALQWQEREDNLFDNCLNALGALTFQAEGYRFAVLRSAAEIRSVQRTFPSLRAAPVLDLLLENIAAIAISPSERNDQVLAVAFIQSQARNECGVWDLLLADGHSGLVDLANSLAAHLAETDWMAKLRRTNVAFHKALRARRSGSDDFSFDGGFL